MAGILGAFVGGWLLGVLGISIDAGFISDVIVELVGAVVQLLVLRARRRLYANKVPANSGEFHCPCQALNGVIGCCQVLSGAGRW
ncbi:MAG: GlsB/YeaQ/YmgE family stress response membrane protein [Anaerolineales bacterium]